MWGVPEHCITTTYTVSNKNNGAELMCYEVLIYYD